MTVKTEEIAKRFLRYALNDIDFSYDELTETEKELATREEFEALVTWVRVGEDVSKIAAQDFASQAAEEIEGKKSRLGTLTGRIKTVEEG